MFDILFNPKVYVRSLKNMFFVFLENALCILVLRRTVFKNTFFETHFEEEHVLSDVCRTCSLSAGEDTDRDASERVSTADLVEERLELLIKKEETIVGE